MFGVSSMTAPLRRVAVRNPGPSLLTADPDAWHYGSNFSPDAAVDNHASFTALLKNNDIDVLVMDQHDEGIADAVFTYDASLVTPEGAILMSPGKELRRGEQQVHRKFYEQNSIPVIGEIIGDGLAEAGDTLWLDDNLLAIGRGFRTNQSGSEQLTEILNRQDIRTEVFDLPVYTGEAACLHLMSLVSLIDTRKALICAPLLPVALWKRMKDLGYELIEAPFDEFEATGTLSTNVLAIAPGHCIMLDGIPKTRAALENAGIRVETFQGDALCIGCEGGPTCLTRPIFRTRKPS